MVFADFVGLIPAMVERVPPNETRWKHAWKHHRGIVPDTAVTGWAVEEEWMTERRRLRTNEDKEEISTDIMITHTVFQ